MKKSRFTTEQIIGFIKQADVHGGLIASPTAWLQSRELLRLAG